MASFGRRTFLGSAGLLASAAAGCRPRPDPYAVEKPPVPVPPNLRVGSETQVLSTCGLCAAGCGIRVRVVEGRAVKVEGNPSSPINRGRLCARGQAALELLYHPDRVRGPLCRVGARGENRWLPLSWDEAIARLTAELGQLRAAGEPQSLVLLDGEERGTTHGLWARFLRAFGSPNHVGHGATGNGAMARAMAAMTGSASLPGYDFENARLVLLVGTGALESSPQAMHLARAVARGARPRLVCAWPRLPPSAALVDEWLPLAPNGQAVLLLALAHVLLRESLADESGLRGFETPAEAVNNRQPGLRTRLLADFAPAQVEAGTGVPAHRIERLARELAAIRPSVVAVDEATSDDTAAAAGLALNALLGSLGTVGGMRRDGGWEQPDWGKLALDTTAERGLRAEAIDGRDPARPAIETSRILSLPDALRSGKPYPAKVLLLAYSNPAYSKPGGRRWLDALAKVPLVVSFSPLLDESARFADLVLPDHTFLEGWDVIVPGRGTRVLSVRQPAVRPLGNSMATGEVVLRLAAALGGKVAEGLPWPGYRAAVEAGLANLPGGVAKVMDAFEAEGSWVAPPGEGAPTGSRAGEEKGLLDVSGALWGDSPAAEGDPASLPFVLVPFRGPGYAEGGARHLPWLCEMPLLGQDPWQPCIEISPWDARELGVADGDRVLVESSQGRVAMPARVHAGIRAGVLGLPLGGGAWPVAGEKDNPSSLLASLTDAKTGQWFACATRARLRKAG
jgi:anaerobic selenocysteine-containing dehydrogenase